MSSKFDGYEKLLQHQRFQSAMSGIQTAASLKQMQLVGNMSQSLHSLYGEMEDMRQACDDAVTIQRQMLEREQIQGDIEEFIYSTQKMIDAFKSEGCEIPLPMQYFNLRGVLETIEECGLTTALVRGRDNKAALETMVERGKELFGRLEEEPEVQEAIQWAKEERRRQIEKKREKQKKLEAKRAEEARAAEEKRQEEERQRISLIQQQDERREALQKKIDTLKSQKNIPSFPVWHKKRFGRFLSGEYNGPFSIPLNLLNQLTAPILGKGTINWVILWVVPCGGLYWILPFYIISILVSELGENSEINREIVRLRNELDQMTTEPALEASVEAAPQAEA